MKNFFIPWNSIYDTKFKYPYEGYKQILDDAGAQDIKKQRQENWFLLPKVITFKYPEEDVADLENKINKIMNQIWILILPKNW